MNRIKYLITILIFSATSSYSQQNDVDFLVSAIKDSYSGYNIKTSNKTFNSYVKKISRSHATDTFRILSEITRYFKDPHLAVYRNKRDQDTAHLNIKEVSTYFLNTKKSKDKYEGYWINDYNNCVILLKKKNSKQWDYFGYIIESGENGLPKGTVLVRIEHSSGNTALTEYKNPISGLGAYLVTRFKNDSLMIMGYSAKWRKLNAYTSPILTSMSKFNERVRASLLDSTTYVITIPKNTEENTKAVDSIIQVNYQLLSNIPNLIIDIRNNKGGTIRTYTSLLPFIYTNSIVRIGGYRKYSQLLLDNYETDLKEYRAQKGVDTSTIRKEMLEIEEIKMNLGKTKLDAGDTVKFDSIKKFPKNVAIITNYACLSAAEMMVLDFKQSEKVLTFGEKTFGAIDYLDNFMVELPSKKYFLAIPSLTRKIPIGQTKLDGIGIYPDIPISDTVKDWVDFVRNYYKEK